MVKTASATKSEDSCSGQRLNLARESEQLIGTPGTAHIHKCSEFRTLAIQFR